MDTETAKKIIEEARTLLGAPYKFGEDGTDAQKSIDCSFFTKIRFLKGINKDIGRSTILQATHGETVSKKDLQPGDLIFLRGTRGHYNDELYPPEKYGYDFCIGHVVIYTGNCMAIHASGEKGMVVEEPLEEIIRTRGKITIIKRL